MTHLPITISRPEARRLAITHQGLLSASPFGKGKNGVYETISHLGYVQIDTISVAERAHNHILWSRVPDYKQKHLHDLQQKDKRILEFWAHAAAYLPMKDFRFLIPTMDYFRNQQDSWPKSDKQTIQGVLDRIRNEGPLKSRDFEALDKKSSSGWWEWKPAKLALQRLFFTGDIIVTHREGFQRVYDITERVLPPTIDTTPPTIEEYTRYLIFSTIRSHGFARIQEMYYLRRGMRDHVKKMIEVLCDAGEIVRVQVRGIESIFYTTNEILARPVRVANKVKLLSPFDNAVIQRDRLYDLFGFDFQIECYVPKPKRTYGYYCLPILYGDQFYGRVDVKADRKTGILHLVHVILENTKLPNGFLTAFAKGCVEFAQFNNCQAIVIDKISHENLRMEIVNSIEDLL